MVRTRKVSHHLVVRHDPSIIHPPKTPEQLLYEERINAQRYRNK